MTAQNYWQPQSEHLEDSNLARAVRNQGFSDYEQYLAWSIQEPESFWRSVLDDIGYAWHKPFTQVLNQDKGIEWPSWFVGGETNLTYNLLDKHIAAGQGDQVAVIWEGEEGARAEVTYAQLLHDVESLCQGLLDRGFQAGDRVGLHLPMVPELVVAFLAVARLGGIVVPLFSGFGADAIRVRMEASKAKWLFTADGFYRRGKDVALIEAARAAVANLSQDICTIVVNRLAQAPQLQSSEVSFQDLCVETNGVVPVYGPPDTPFMFIYTSGTTGAPKGTVHVHAGFPLKAAQDMYHLFDVRASDNVFWLTDIGWMMGPWLILGTLTLGASVVLYDGAPDFPGDSRVWQVLSDNKVTIAGISPTLVRAMMAKGTEPVRSVDLSTIRVLGSTGEPWNPEPWQWAFQEIGGGKAPIINYSGGTEISGGILGCCVLKPIRPAAFNTMVPGVYADIFDEGGNAVQNELGNLVVRNVCPGMTSGLWEDDARYLETYWQRYPGVWDHGDLALRDALGDYYITGRSDDTIKVAGKRLGPAEMESIAVEHTAVVEAAVVGIPDAMKGQTPVVFAVLQEGHIGDAELALNIRGFIADGVGKALQPKAVYFVSDLPKTRSAKVMRRVLRRVFLGEDPGNLSSLVNPETIDEIAKLRPQEEAL